MRKMFILMFLFFTASALVACGDASDSKSGKESLVIYSNSVSDGRGDWLKEKAAEAGFEIQYVDAGGGELANRLSAEKNNPIADVVFGLNTIDYENFKTEDLLEQYEPSWASDVSEGLNDPDGYYHGLVKQAILLIYNNELYDEETSPKDWPDLWENEEFHGKYEMPSGFDGGTTRVVISGILTRYTDPDGEHGISQEGWDQIEEYLKYASYTTDGEEFYANLASGESPLGQMWSSGIEAREEQYGVEAGIVRPEIGVPYVVEQVAIVKDTKSLSTAKEFVDWFGSEEVQTEWSNEFSTMPANEKSLEDSAEDIQALESSLMAQDMDWSFIAKNINYWTEKIELELVP